MFTCILLVLEPLWSLVRILLPAALDLVPGLSAVITLARKFTVAFLGASTSFTVVVATVSIFLASAILGLMAWLLALFADSGEQYHFVVVSAIGTDTMRQAPAYAQLNRRTRLDFIVYVVSSPGGASSL